jgi:hypothetical protein
MNISESERGREEDEPVRTEGPKGLKKDSLKDSMMGSKMAGEEKKNKKRRGKRKRW